MRVFHLLIIFGFCFYGCNKSKEMKEKLFPERPYEAAKIDNFYWADVGWDYAMVPLIKPYKLTKLQGKKEWLLNSSISKNEIGDITPLESFSVNDIYIYGIQNEDLNFDETEMNPKVYFVINTKDLKITYFEKESDFKSELKKLNLTEEMLTPDAVFEQYKNNPVLPWFPEDIKKQLEEVKKQKGN